VPLAIKKKLLQSQVIFRFEHSHGPYDSGSFYDGDTKFAQLTLMRDCEAAKSLVSLLKRQGVQIIVPTFEVANEVK
jgi:hypothetical protein